MAFTDKTIKCKDCGEDFVFTAGEQEFYAEKGFQNEPIRCKTCRAAKKASSGKNFKFSSGSQFKSGSRPKSDRF